MRILMVTPEAVPYAKTGGLADVAAALPRALARLGHEVDVVMPRYRGLNAGSRVARLSIPLGAEATDTDFYAVGADAVRTIFVDHKSYYDRDHLYGIAERDYADNPERFAFLSQAALSWAAANPSYDIVHAHDWQTGLVPVLQAQMFRSGALPGRLPTVFTIHNLAYQGIFDASWLPRLGLSWDLMRMDALEYWGRISFLKAGIVFSRLITSVSPTYAQEIQTPEFGFGFDGILRDRAADLVGILNGIDYDQWDPSADPNLPEPFSASHLEGKQAAKRALHETLNLPTTDDVLGKPTIGLVSRLVDQKGFDLLAALADELPRLGATLTLLGSGERRYEDLWLGLAARYPDRIGVRIGFDERLAHLIKAGADLFLMPCRFEPRAEPVVQPALRNRAAGARDGGVVRHGAQFRRPNRDWNGIYVRRVFTAGAARHPQMGSWRLSRSGDLASYSDRGNAGGLFLGRLGAAICRGVRTCGGSPSVGVKL